MFTDLVGFTKATEELGPQKVAHILNQYLVEMSEVVFRYEGLVDKFIGDGIMALFGVPTKMDTEIQIGKAVACARGMLDRLAEKDGLPQLNVRVGIHQGPVIVGHFGGTRRSDFTAIGNAVNMAARIESSAGPGEVFISSVANTRSND